MPATLLATSTRRMTKLLLPMMLSAVLPALPNTSSRSAPSLPSRVTGLTLSTPLKLAVKAALPAVVVIIS
ncbi:hypothetical protein D3C73_1471620 [compost metagenome]